MCNEVSGLGVDVIEICRFNQYTKNINSKFLLNNFTQQELDYCFSYADVATHLAGTFAAKEAVFKAFNIKNLPQAVIEIRRNSDGRPAVWIKNNQHKKILISISHTQEFAVAVAIKK